MKRISLLSSTLIFALITACGGGSDSAEGGMESGEMAETPSTEPAAPAAADWFQVDEASMTVTMTITAGLTPDQNYWNFNGFTKANPGTITVPEGYTVNITLVNNDPNMAHSLGIEEWQETWGGTVEVSPAFEGAVTENPGSLTDATMPGESESISFVASQAGNYTMICYVPGHAALGMVANFVVSTDGSSGVM